MHILSLEGWENVLFELRSERVNWLQFDPSLDNPTELTVMLMSQENGEGYSWHFMDPTVLGCLTKAVEKQDERHESHFYDFVPISLKNQSSLFPPNSHPFIRAPRSYLTEDANKNFLQLRLVISRQPPVGIAHLRFASSRAFSDQEFHAWVISGYANGVTVTTILTQVRPRAP